MIHPGARLGEIGEADPEFEQRRELARLIAARRDAGLMDRTPEAVAGMGVVVPEFGRACAGGGADEDEAQVGAELVGEAVEGRFGQINQPERCSPHERQRHVGQLSVPDVASLIRATLFLKTNERVGRPLRIEYCRIGWRQPLCRRSGWPSTRIRSTTQRWPYSI